jgi:cytochrome c-type biogenesis protein CcmF
MLTLGITAGQLLGLLRARLGRLVVLGPGRERLADAVLAATALLHSVSVLATRDGLRALDGDARRRRILNVDAGHVPGPIGHPRPACMRSPSTQTRGTFILALLALYIGGALALFASRIGAVRAGAVFEPVSREGRWWSTTCCCV